MKTLSNTQKELILKGAKLYRQLSDMHISLKDFKTELKCLFDQSGLTDFSTFDMLCYDKSF